MSELLRPIGAFRGLSDEDDDEQVVKEPEVPGGDANEEGEDDESLE